MLNLSKPVLQDGVRVSTCQMIEWVKARFASYAYIFLTGNHLAHFFWQHKIDRNIELIRNTFVKRKRTDILVLQMVGPRHGVSDANSWSVPPMIECCTFGIFQVFWGLPLSAPLYEKSSTTKNRNDVKVNINTTRQFSYFCPKMGWDVSH